MFIKANQVKIPILYLDNWNAKIQMQNSYKNKHRHFYLKKNNKKYLKINKEKYN